MFEFIQTAIQFFTHNLLFTAGIYIFIATAALLILGYYKSKILFIISLAFLLFSLYFFRNPERTPASTEPHALISPADGHVVDIGVYDDPTYGKVQRVSIFLSPLDVHVNWTPIAGTIEAINYRPGKFVVAYAPKSSEINERNDIVIKTESTASTPSTTIVVRQIAGFVARRICWWINPGDKLPACYKYGMIRFGSRVDILMPLTATIAVTKDQYVMGGHTLLGRLA